MHGVRVIESPVINSDETRAIFHELDVDLGLSLGNGYIAKSVFSIPRCGMINIHAEVLPDFQGAPSVIWPIHENLETTGYTIHQIDKGIDTGEILLLRQYPIELRRTLRETVEANVARSNQDIPVDMCRVVANYGAVKAAATVQSGGSSYTTPSCREFLRMRRNHARMARRESD